MAATDVRKPQANSVCERWVCAVLPLGVLLSLQLSSLGEHACMCTGTCKAYAMEASCVLCIVYMA